MCTCVCKTKYSVLSIKKIFVGDKLHLLRQDLPQSLCIWWGHVPVLSAAPPSSGNTDITQGKMPPPCHLSMDLPASNITLSRYLLQMQLFLGSKRASKKTYQSFDSIRPAGSRTATPRSDRGHSHSPQRSRFAPEANGTSGNSPSPEKVEIVLGSTLGLR